MGYKIKPSTGLSASCALIQTTLLTFISATFITENPLSNHQFIAGGIAACFSGAISTFLAFLGFISDILYFNDISRYQTFGQKKFEQSNLYLILYIVFGGLLFTYLEAWDFERASEFCLVTLLTIGYGDTVPVTILGRLCMIVFSCVGLLVSGFYLLSYEDVINEDEYEMNDLSIIDLPHEDANVTTNQISLTFSKAGKISRNLQQEIAQDKGKQKLGADHKSVADFRFRDTVAYDPDLISIQQGSESDSELGSGSDLDLKLQRYDTGPDSDFKLQRFDTQDSQTSKKASIVKEAVFVIVWVSTWWLGCSFIFTQTEKDWHFIDAAYFSFVTMTGIGYGDFKVNSPIGIEVWWIFIFNAILVISYFITLAGLTISKGVTKHQLRLQRTAVIRQFRRKKKIEALLNSREVNSLGHTTTLPVSLFKKRVLPRSATLPDLFALGKSGHSSNKNM
jgi:potassium channel subfamily K